MADFVIYAWQGELHCAIEYMKRKRTEQLHNEKGRFKIPFSDDEIKRVPFDMIKALHRHQFEDIQASMELERAK